MNVASRARRTLKHLASYSEAAEGQTGLPPWAREVSLKEGETVLGIYRNSPSALEETIVVTNLGLHVRRQAGWEAIGYSQIRSIKTPPEKSEATQLTAELEGGRSTDIPVRGGEGRFRDAFEFMRFLDRVKDDIRDSRS